MRILSIFIAFIALSALPVFAEFSVFTKNIIGYHAFAVSYNYSIGQPNWAAALKQQWVKSSLNCGCYDPPKWQDSVNYTCTDYNCLDSGECYHRSQLISRFEHGTDTCIFTNAVPMLNKSRQDWNCIERNLLANHIGKLIFRGCQYDYSKFVITKNLHKQLYIPEGCYYIVTDLQDYGATFGIVDYGYLRFGCQTIEKRLPWWITEIATPKERIKSNSSWYVSMFAITVFVAGVVLTVSWAIILILLTRRRNEYE